MTKPRQSVDREILGIIGPHPKRRAIQKEWNKKFKDNQMDAFIDYYATKENQLPERLSEMFHFDRTMYIVDSSLGQAIKPLLDEIDPSVGEGSVDTVFNREGVLIGYFVGDTTQQWECLLKGDFNEH